MTEFPGPVVYGTIGYFAACVALVLGFKGCQMTGSMTKENVNVGIVVVTISTICMWMLWAMAWFQQWHPLINPEYP